MGKMPLGIVVEPAASVVQKHTIAVKLFAVGTHKNVGFAVPVETKQHWYEHEPLTRDVCNQVIKSVIDDKTGKSFLNSEMSKFNDIDESQIATITEKAWKLFSTQTNCGDEELAISETMKAKNGAEDDVFMGDLSYVDKHGEIATQTSLNIWFIQGLEISCVLLPGGLGMSYNPMPAGLQGQNSNSQNSNSKSQLQISTLVGSQGKMDRYIPRHNKARFEYASQKMNCANTIDISKAVTRTEQHALLDHDNLDFMQSLGVTDVPHSTTALHSNSLGMHIYINSCSLQGENHVVQNIYF